jgi:cyclase
MGVFTSLITSASPVVYIDQQMKIYLGGGCNSVVLLSNNNKKALIVDTKYFKSAKKLRREINVSEITIINTHFHLDHARGNSLYPNAFIISGSTNWKQWDFDTAHSKRPDKILNPGDELILQLDDETIHIADMGKAHSPNDIVVFFENRKVLAAGDLVWVNMHPLLLDKNTNIQLWITYLDKIAKTYDFQTVIPGHGKISGRETIWEMKEYFTSILQAIDSEEKLSLLKSKYARYATFPLFGSFHRTVNLIKKEVHNNSL